MILDLKGKLHDLFSDIDFEDDEHSLLTMAENGALDEAIMALEALGYTQRELNKVKPVLEKDDLDTEGYMKKALHLLLTTK